LNVGKDNSAARRFYERHGYRILVKKMVNGLVSIIMDCVSSSRAFLADEKDILSRMVND